MKGTAHGAIRGAFRTAALFTVLVVPAWAQASEPDVPIGFNITPVVPNVLANWVTPN